MKQIVPYIFWPWFATSCFILLRRRVTGGSWKAIPRDAENDDDVWAPPPLDPLPDAYLDDPTPEPAAADDGVATPAVPTSTTGSTTPAEPPGPAPEPRPNPVVTQARPRARSLAEALEGIHMPCELAPLIGAGAGDHRAVSFYTAGFDPTTVGASMSDEFERLGYRITPLDDRTIRAARDETEVEAAMLSEALVGSTVMNDRHPSAPAGALVLELKLV